MRASQRPSSPWPTVAVRAPACSKISSAAGMDGSPFTRCSSRYWCSQFEARSEEVEERLLGLGDPRRVVGTRRGSRSGRRPWRTPGRSRPAAAAGRARGCRRRRPRRRRRPGRAARRRSPARAPRPPRGRRRPARPGRQRQELPEERGAPPHIQDAEAARPSDPDALQEGPHQLVALELVEGEVANVEAWGGAAAGVG